MKSKTVSEERKVTLVTIQKEEGEYLFINRFFPVYRGEDGIKIIMLDFDEKEDIGMLVYPDTEYDQNIAIELSSNNVKLGCKVAPIVLDGISKEIYIDKKRATDGIGLKTNILHDRERYVMKEMPCIYYE